MELALSWIPAFAGMTFMKWSFPSSQVFSVVLCDQACKGPSLWPSVLWLLIFSWLPLDRLGVLSFVEGLTPGSWILHFKNLQNLPCQKHRTRHNHRTVLSCPIPCQFQSVADRFG